MILNILSLQNFTHIFSIASSIILSLLGITGIIVFHEFGHFIFCKFFGVYTPTFSVGMGKKLFTKMIGTTEFCISAAPLGGYVEIANETSHGQKGFNSINYLQKFLIILGGIGFNMLFAYIVFSALFYVGMPDSAFMPYENTQPIIKTISPASINHGLLESNDIIVSINNTSVENRSEIIKDAINNCIAQEKTDIPVIIERDKQQHSITLKLNPDKKPLLLEERLELCFLRKAPLTLTQSISNGIALTNFYIVTIFSSLKSLLATKNTQGLAGPIMTLTSSTKIAQKGLKSLLIFLAIISINLGIMNLLPLPIFDGGQFVLFTIETIMKREMSDNIKEMIGMFSWFLILGLMIVFSIKDIYTLIYQYIL
jgi:regulator of sigma E protease